MLWSKEIFEVNPDCQVTVEYVGPGKHKVLLADNFYRHPQQVGELALNLYYHEAQALVGGYPGSRAVVTLGTTPLIGALSKLWGEPLVPFHSDYHPVIFSAIINRNYQLNAWQRQPRLDQGVTAMVYLNPEEAMLGRDRALPPLPHRPRSVADRHDFQCDPTGPAARDEHRGPETRGRVCRVHQHRDL